MLFFSSFHNRLQLGEPLGEGAFGRVVKAIATGVQSRTEPSTVAVKMLKGKYPKDELYTASCVESIC